MPSLLFFRTQQNWSNENKIESNPSASMADKSKQSGERWMSCVQWIILRAQTIHWNREKQKWEFPGTLLSSESSAPRATTLERSCPDTMPGVPGPNLDSVGTFRPFSEKVSDAHLKRYAADRALSWQSSSSPRGFSHPRVEKPSPFPENSELQA